VWTGYRYYSPEQLQILLSIVQFKQLGFSLAEIAKMGYEIADAPRACYVDGIWNQEDPGKRLTIIQVPVQK